MAGEVQFTNDNEKAFALFRRGCRHCAELLADLDDVAPKDVIVAFLVRVAARPGAVRQLQELGSILVRAAAWREKLASAPQPLWDVLVENPSTFAALQETPSSSQSPAPFHDARVFLRERQSHWYLTVAQTEECIMTDLATSLFICSRAADCEEHHCAMDGARSPHMFSALSVERECERSAMETHKSAEVEAQQTCGGCTPATVGFAHEGVPACGRFLICRRSGRRLTLLRDGPPGGGNHQLCCAGHKFGPEEAFRWHVDGTLQHVESGRWLYVDPACPGKVDMHLHERSVWDALPAI